MHASSHPRLLRAAFTRSSSQRNILPLPATASRFIAVVLSSFLASVLRKRHAEGVNREFGHSQSPGRGGRRRDVEKVEAATRREGGLKEGRDSNDSRLGKMLAVRLTYFVAVCCLYARNLSFNLSAKRSESNEIQATPSLTLARGTVYPHTLVGLTSHTNQATFPCDSPSSAILPMTERRRLTPSLVRDMSNSACLTEAERGRLMRRWKDGGRPNATYAHKWRPRRCHAGTLSSSGSRRSRAGLYPAAVLLGGCGEERRGRGSRMAMER
ncbi:hypothetical protein R3P38DRAFT_2760122 [Favolaschia claudopus]|uniref:Uncharacterized protein n=1 Tax=Favolaschia claudopus TaxID=2862362 RepID=A0AAW0E2Z4_9AGAR